MRGCAVAVHLRFGLPAEIPARIKTLIKRADRISAWLEAVQIAGFAEAEADRFFGKPPAPAVEGMTIAPRPPVEVRAEFIARYRGLEKAMGLG
jgi:uncharacterized protein